MVKWWYEIYFLLRNEAAQMNSWNASEHSHVNLSVNTLYSYHQPIILQCIYIQNIYVMLSAAVHTVFLHHKVVLTGHTVYLNLLNLSLSASNMCLRLRFRACAVYQSCSFWKLGSCVSPMFFRGGLLCSAVLNYPD